jgi:hypothetical protein
MKWYKHLVDSGDDPDIDDALNKFGPAGYYFFFRLLEIMSREFDVNHPGENVFSLKYIRNRIRLKSTSILLALEFYQERKRLYYRFIDDDHIPMLWIKCPKLQQLADEFTKKQLSKKSGLNQEPLRNPMSVEVEVRSKKKIKNKESISHSEDRNPHVKEFISFYFSTFKEKFGVAPTISGAKDGSLIKTLLKAASLEELKELLGRFFDSGDSWILKSGYTIGAFYSVQNKLKIGESHRDGLDLWEEVKEKQDERRRQKEIQVIDAEVEGHVSK